jgi:hypothetical protein
MFRFETIQVKITSALKKVYTPKATGGICNLSGQSRHKESVFGRKSRTVVRRQESER